MRKFRKRQKSKIHKSHTYMDRPIYVIAMGFLFFIFVMFLSYKIWMSYKYSRWDGEKQLTFVYEQNQITYFIKINPKLEELNILEFDPNTMIDIARGYENYKLSKIYKLAQQEHINYGQLLKESMTSYLGVLTDGYLTGISGDFNLSKALFLSLINRTNTNFTDFDVIRILLYLHNTRYENINHIVITDTKYFDNKIFPDGSQAYVINNQQWKKYALTDFADPDFLSEKYTWEIYNGTTKNGLGESVRKILTNSGFDVVGVRQADNLSDQSKIIINKNLVDNPSIKKFADYFKFPIQVSIEGNLRSDVILIIGSDYLKLH